MVFTVLAVVNDDKLDILINTAEAALQQLDLSILGLSKSMPPRVL